MSSPRDSVRDDPKVRDERIRNAMRSEIDRAINFDHSTTKAELAQQSGVNIHTIEAIMSEDKAKHRRLKSDVVFSLMHTLGEHCVNSMLATFQYGGAAPLDQVDARQPMAVVASCMKHFAVFTDAAADNRIDHTEQRPTADAADGIIAELIPFSSAGRS